MEWERQSGGQPRALLITSVGINIECLMDEKDVREFIKREEFEKLSADLLERVLVPIKKALADSGLGVDGVNSVELVGSGSRIPAIIRILMGFFGKEPRRILNASECMAKGCALRSAMLSLVFRVREYEVTFIPYITIGDPDMSTTSMALKVLDSCW